MIQKPILDTEEKYTAIIEALENLPENKNEEKI